MNCSKCQKLCDEAASGALTERLDRKVRDHLESCPACAVFYRENESLRSLLRDTAVPQAIPEEAYFRRLARQAAAQSGNPGVLPANPAGPGWFENLAAQLGGLVRATTVLAAGAFIGFVLSQIFFGAKPNGPDNQTAKEPTPTPKIEYVYVTPAPLPYKNEQILPPFEARVRPTTVADGGLQDLPDASPLIEKIPSHEESPEVVSTALLDSGRGKIPAVDPQQFLATMQQAMSLIETIPPTEEYKSLQKIGQVSRQVNVGSVLASLQDLKIELVRNGQAEHIPLVHKIEDLVNAVALATPESRGQHFAHLETYQQAELAMLEGDSGKSDYQKAMDLFRRVVIQAPGSYFAALAKYEIGNINYEHYRNYEDALVDYTQCLEESDPRFLSEHIVKQIHERVQLITQNSRSNYEPLSLYNRAESASDWRKSFDLYTQLILDYPDSTLIRPAFEAMTLIARRHPANKGLVSRAVGVFDQFQQKNPDHPLKLYAELGIADVVHYPLRDRAQARIDYAKILREARDPALVATLQDRLSQIEDDR